MTALHGSVRSAADPDAVARALETARATADGGPLPAWRRAEILDAACELLQEQREGFAQLIVAEVRKTVRDARAEIDRAVATLRFSAVVARTLTGETIPADATAAGEGALAFTLRVPLGVVAAITPFNYPVNLVFHKIAPAFAAGNAVLLKPAPQAPLCAHACARLLVEAGMPAEWLQVLTGGADVGAAMTASPLVDAITFTGSTQVGWAIAAGAPSKRVLLELGSNAPLLVTRSADVERAAAAVATYGFGNSGQSCVSVQRVLVDEAVAVPFRARLLERVGALRSGDPSDPATDVGPVIDAAAHERIVAWVDAACAAGATRHTPGPVDADGLIAPTVLEDVPLDALAWRDEVFGPVVCLRVCASLDEQIRLANDSRYGLQAGIFTADLSEALRAVRELRFGGVVVNDAPTKRLDPQPYGGVKDSGNTREGPHAAAREMTEERFVSLRQ
jgi:acyl-CoA reductase-like NAD-dependent aldehyde dehydrogenase